MEGGGGSAVGGGELDDCEFDQTLLDVLDVLINSRAVRNASSLLAFSLRLYHTDERHKAFCLFLC